MWVKSSRFLSLASSTACGAMALALSSPAQAIVPNDNYTPTDVIDDTGANGVGMFYRNDGFVCTGTLINPRMVIFAAHCVNDRPESDYDTNGTIQSAFSFDDNALPGFQNWISSGFASNADLAVYNVSRINYDPRSLEDPDNFGFLEADVAVATLDTPATEIPTWVLLFSRLPDPAMIDPVAGTGYHVNITGYGRSGNGTDGDTQGIDWRRRAAENMLGSLSSLNTRGEFLFGDPPGGNRPQNLYNLDFDDPNEMNEFDFNLFKDEALDREATTAGGDSGGPLILDAASNSLSEENLVLAVLSGGSRFFGPQVFSSYGTQSFYQPLYLYWDYIAAVNPMRYATAVAGDGNWEDPSHWVTQLDPAYRIIDGMGDVVPGIPDAVGAGTSPDGDPGFGEICYDPRGPSNPPDDVHECQDIATGNSTPPVREGAGSAEITLSADETSMIGVASLDGSAPAQQRARAFLERTAETETVSLLPAATLANGLPGATDFVPNNRDADPSTGTNAYYFDVTLDQAGTTKLSSEIEIDRLTVMGAADLTLRPNGDLTVLTDYTQMGGRLRVDGRLTTGEALVIDGFVRGNGVIDPTFMTFVGGEISPDGARIGTLTIQGDVILSSQTKVKVDVAETGSDVLAITADTDNGGLALLGGTVRFIRRNADPQVRDGQSFDFLTAEGLIVGEFDRVRSRGLGILEPVVTYSSNAATVTFEAGMMADHINLRNPTALAFANALDSLRGSDYNSLYGLYGALDVMDSANMTATLANLAPTIMNEAMAVGIGQNDLMIDVVSSRLSMLGSNARTPGTFSVIGAPEMVGIAASNASISRASATQMSFANRVAPDGRTLGTLPDNISGFISGGYENRTTASSLGSRSDSQANWHIAMGLEVEVTDNLTVGGASAYINGRSTLQGSEALLQTNQLMAYASYNLGGGAYVAGLGSASMTDIEAARFVNGGYETARFGSNTRATNYTAGIETGVNMDIARDFHLTPRAAVRYSDSTIQGYSEAGSEIALAVDDFRQQRLEGRVGFAFNGEREVGSGWTLRPQLSADYVRAIGDVDNSMTVRLVQASSVGIDLPGLAGDRQWTEVRGGLSLDRGNLSVSTAFETDIGRSQLRDDRAVAEVSFRF